MIFLIGTEGKKALILLDIFTWGKWRNNMAELGNPLKVRKI